MRLLSRCIRVGVSLALVGGLVGHDSRAAAGTLVLSDVPLFLGTDVAPNVLLSFDDSGSMDFEVLTKDFAKDGAFAGTQRDGTSPAGSGTIKNRDNTQNGSADCTSTYGIAGYIYGVTFTTNTFGGGSNNCETADNAEWRFRNYQFNSLYFNPNRTYKPWAGVDANGTPFADMDIHNAKDNPYNPSSLKLDLTQDDSRGPSSGSTEGFRYYNWSDNNSNGRFDNGEETVVYIRNANAATQQNFANWFSYYRSREYVFKAIYGNLIANATRTRMGLVTLHNNVNGIKSSVTSVNTAIKLMEVDPTIGAKRALLDALYAVHANGGTPLRVTMNKIGQYLECAAGRSLFSTDCPALPVAQGGACQQNFLIFATDGFDNASFSALPSSNANADGNQNTAFDGRAYKDSYSHTLADIAMHYYERDLQPSLANTVPTTPGVDEAKHQHMVTYTISFGLDGTLTSSPTNPTLPFTWPDPAASSAAKIDDLRHAAYNGRGLYLNGSDPGTLESALNDALKDIIDRTSSAASVALNSGSQSTNSRIYQARFNSGDWSGQLLALPIDDHGNVGTAVWDGAAVLDKAVADDKDFYTKRTILTYKPSTKAGIAFRWSDLDPAQQTALHTNSSTINDGLGLARLNYLRGSRVDEEQGNRFRVRLHLLGDLINSDPIYVGPPPFSDSLGSDYATFRNTYAQRKPLVVVGSNDGYLHALEAATGREVLAYLPSVLMPKMSKLTSPSYAHLYYTDGSPTAGDVFGDFNRNGTPIWRTVLVGGLRTGGQGYYALDITDSSTFSEGNASKLVLWEFTDADDKDLGVSFAQPAIVRMANGRWAAVFGNGYNNSINDGSSTTSTTGTASLFIVFLDGRASGTWQKDIDYIKIDTGVGSVATPNGLATPAPIDTNGNTTVEYVVAGDLQGNMWTFDVSSADPSQWKVRYTDSAGKPRPLYTAKDADGNVQPITVRPEVGEHPERVGVGYLVYFGTGKYIETTDKIVDASTKTQTMYTIWDKPNVVPGEELPILGRSNLQQQSVLTTVAVSGKTVRVSTQNSVNWQTQRGFYMDWPTTGERQVSTPLLRAGRLMLTTLIPDPNICSFGGTSFLMELNAANGAPLTHPAFDLNNDGVFTAADQVTVTINATPTLISPSGMASTEGILATPKVLRGGAGAGGGGGGGGDCGGVPCPCGGRPDAAYSSGSTGDIFKADTNPPRETCGRQAWQQLYQ